MHEEAIDPAVTLRRVRERTPLIHNITNLVAMGSMANILLATGASPAMAHAREEASELTVLAAALTINIGTPSPHWVMAMKEAAGTASERALPWVLDPVAVGATAYRHLTAEALLEHRPDVIRGNASEILALSGIALHSGRGVDSTDSTRHAEEAARRLAEKSHSVVAVTGSTDFVTDGERGIWVHGGHPLMPCISTLGCGLTGVVAAFVAADREAATGDADPLLATASALAYYATAGEQAATNASGPGSFFVAFLDALYGLQTPSLQGRCSTAPD
ncbi:MAG: hydroxyethylthiazole kinase [Halorhodospira sp.]